MLKSFVGGFVLGAFLLVALAVSLLVSGCASTPNAPAKDTTGATPTGQTLTITIKANAPTGFLSYKRGDAMPINLENIALPYTQTFNVRGSDRFEFAASVPNNTTAAAHIEVLLNGAPVASAKQGEGSAPQIAHLVYTVPER